MSDTITTRHLHLIARSETATPACETHVGSFVRRYRTNGPNGPGVYPQCVPANGDSPHLLSWSSPVPVAQRHVDTAALSSSELDVLDDAANGLTAPETALRRGKGVETVKTQRRSILLKLGARNMPHAVAKAIGAHLADAQRAA
jgi:DNA-binding CsgD family transcriptional regulator